MPEKRNNSIAFIILLFTALLIIGAVVYNNCYSCTLWFMTREEIQQEIKRNQEIDRQRRNHR